MIDRDKQFLLWLPYVALSYYVFYLLLLLQVFMSVFAITDISMGTPNLNIMIIMDFLVNSRLCTLTKMIWVDRNLQSTLLSTISMQK